MFTAIVLGISTDGYNEKFRNVIKAMFMPTLHQNYPSML